MLCRRTIEKNYKGYVQFSKQWDEALGQAVNAEVAGTLLGTGMKLKAADFGLEKATPRGAETRLDACEVSMTKIKQGLGSYEEVMVQGLNDALGLLNVALVRERIEHGTEILEEARGLYPYVTFLHMRVLDELAPCCGPRGFGQFTRDAQTRQRKPPAHRSLPAPSRAIKTNCSASDPESALSMPYPFEHAQGDISMSKYILPFVPESEQVGDLMSFGGDAIDRVISLSQRILGRLAVAGELVETA